MKKILIIKPSSLGDVLHAFPAVAALASACGKDKCAFSWLIHPAFSDLLDYLPFVKKKIFFERKLLGKFSTFFPAFFRLLVSLREEKYDAVYDLQGLFRSGIFSFLTGSPLRYGSTNPREKIAKLFYNRTMSYPEGVQHAADKLCHMVSSTSHIPLPEKYYTMPVLEKFRKTAFAAAKEAGLDIPGVLAEGKKLIAVAPGARWQSKMWAEKYFAEIISELHREEPEKYCFMLLGSPAERESISRLKELLSPIEVFDLCGKTSVGELVELIRAADMLLCNDSGPMHIAAFTETVPAAFFGPTDPVLTGPCSRNALIFQAQDLPCIKCFKKSCEDLSCHSKLDLAGIITSIRSILRSSPTSCILAEQENITVNCEENRQ